MESLSSFSGIARCGRILNTWVNSQGWLTEQKQVPNILQRCLSFTQTSTSHPIYHSQVRPLDKRSLDITRQLATQANAGLGQNT